jgi:hypothetical protein
MRHLAEVHNVVSEQRLEVLGEEAVLVIFPHLGRDQQPAARTPHRPGGMIDTLFGDDAAEEQEIEAVIVAVTGTHRVGVGVEPVVDHCGDRDPSRTARLVLTDGDDRHARGDPAVERRQVAFEGPVIGGDHGQVELVGAQRPGQRVVVHDVRAPVGERLVPGDDMVEFDDRRADALALRRREDVPSGDRARGVAGRPQHDLVAGPLQAASELVDHGFGAAIGGRRHGYPWRRKDSDPHSCLRRLERLAHHYP